MKHILGTGCVGTASYIIMGNDIEYNAIVKTQNEQFETKFSCWEAAQKWVDSMIMNIEEMGHEAGRDY